MPKAHNKAQLALDEKIVDDLELLRALIDREAAREQLAAVRFSFVEADDLAKELLGPKLAELEPGAALRVGDWRITKTTTTGRAVSFETKPSSRIRIESIKPGEDDGGTE